MHSVEGLWCKTMWHMVEKNPLETMKPDGVGAFVCSGQLPIFQHRDFINYLVRTEFT